MERRNIGPPPFLCLKVINFKFGNIVRWSRCLNMQAKIAGKVCVFMYSIPILYWFYHFFFNFRKSDYNREHIDVKLPKTFSKTINLPNSSFKNNSFQDSKVELAHTVKDKQKIFRYNDIPVNLPVRQNRWKKKQMGTKSWNWGYIQPIFYEVTI